MKGQWIHHYDIIPLLNRGMEYWSHLVHPAVGTFRFCCNILNSRWIDFKFGLWLLIKTGHKLQVILDAAVIAEIWNDWDDAAVKW